MYRAAFVLTAFLAASVIHGADEDKPQRLPPDKARARIGAHLVAENPKLRLTDDFAVVELTTDPIWKRLNIQIFKVKSGLSEQATFMLRGNDVFGIGTAFGGSGVESLCVADFGDAKRPLLAFTYSWGSGIHRSHVAICDCRTKEPKVVVAPLTNFSFDDFRVRFVEDKTVEVYAGKHKVGLLQVEKKGDQINATIRLDEKLPKAVRENLKE